MNLDLTWLTVSNALKWTFNGVFLTLGYLVAKKVLIWLELARFFQI